MAMLAVFDALAGPPSVFFPVLFRISLAFEQGYTLDVTHCASCGAILQEHGWAGCSIEEGYFLCPSCSQGRAIFRISWQAVSLLDHLKKTAIGKWVDWIPDRQLQAEICEFADRFIRYHLGIADEDNRFVRC